MRLSEIGHKKNISEFSVESVFNNRARDNTPTTAASKQYLSTGSERVGGVGLYM